MGQRWQLAIYNPEQEYDLVPVSDYLQLREQGSVSWVPQLYDSSIFFEAGREWIAGKWNLGDVGRLILQFEAAAPRVAAKEFALIRSGVDDDLLVPFLLLDSREGPEVKISLFIIEDPRLAIIYPISKIPGEPDKLYDYVREHYSEFSSPAIQGSDEFRTVPFSREKLIECLNREAAFGRRLYETLGEPIIW